MNEPKFKVGDRVANAQFELEVLDVIPRNNKYYYKCRTLTVVINEILVEHESQLHKI